MSLEELVPVLIVVTFVSYMILERVLPARPLPQVRGWLPKGIVFFVLAMAMNGLVPALVTSAIGPRSLLGLTWLGTVGGALVTLLVGDLVNYWIHRTMHNVDWVWRWTHQMHHSAERMDMAGASYFHPFDFVFGNVLPGTLVVAALGVTPAAAALAGILGFVLGVFPHLNVRTPRWLGWVLQRPEMHALHHQRGVHAYNYGMFAFTDRLFGTWRNPPTFPDAPMGFWDGASSKVGAMLLGRDVSRPPA